MPYHPSGKNLQLQANPKSHADKLFHLMHASRPLLKRGDLFCEAFPQEALASQLLQALGLWNLVQSYIKSWEVHGLSWFANLCLSSGLGKMRTAGTTVRKLASLHLALILENPAMLAYCCCSFGQLQLLYPH